MLVINSRLQIPLDELEFTYARVRGRAGRT